MGWKAIETAPTDGTPIQGWVRVVHDSDGVKSEWYPHIRFYEGAWQHKHSHGWFDLNISALSWVHHTPTHWDYQPDPPSAGDAIQDTRNVFAHPTS